MNVSGSELWVEIRIKGQIDKNWSAWFKDMTINHSEDGNTLLSGIILDQAALYGLLSRLSSLGLSLISVSSQQRGRGGTA